MEFLEARSLKCVKSSVTYHHLLFEGTDIFVQFSNVFSDWILSLHEIRQKYDWNQHL